MGQRDSLPSPRESKTSLSAAGRKPEGAPESSRSAGFGRIDCGRGSRNEWDSKRMTGLRSSHSGTPISAGSTLVTLTTVLGGGGLPIDSHFQDDRPRNVS